MLQKWIMPIALFMIGACSSFERYRTVDENFWMRNPSVEQSINIGYFDIQAGGDSKKIRTNLMSSIVFHLRSRGYRVADFQEYASVIEGRNLPMTRTLSEQEVLLLAGSLKERFMLQGVYQETTAFAVPYDRTNVTLAITIHDARSGKQVGEFRIYGSGLESYSPHEVFQLSERFVEDFNAEFQEYRK